MQLEHEHWGPSGPTVETCDKKSYDKKSRPSNVKKINNILGKLIKSNNLIDSRLEICYFLSYVSIVNHPVCRPRKIPENRN